MSSPPTSGETFSKLLEHLRLAQEDAAMMAHLEQMQDTQHSRRRAIGWLGVSEQLGLTVKAVTVLATKGMN